MNRLDKLIELRDVITGKNKSVARQKYSDAAMFRDKEKILRHEYDWWFSSNDQMRQMIMNFSQLELEIENERIKHRDELINEILN
jgi:hypothetical protein